jgi:hypothetical protein
MSNLLLTSLIFVLLPIVIYIIVAILSARGRLETVKLMKQGMRDGRFQDLSDPYKSRRIRICAFLTIVCMVFFFLIAVLALSRLISYDFILIGLLLAVIGSISGHLAYREIIKISKQ